jgi:hypothetical protein
MSGMNDLHPRRGLFSFLLGKEGYGTTQEDEEKKRKLFFHGFMFVPSEPAKRVTRNPIIPKQSPCSEFASTRAIRGQ